MKQAREASERGDVRRLLTIAARIPEHVLINRARGTVMLRSCDKTMYVANLRYRRDHLALIAKLEQRQRILVATRGTRASAARVFATQ
jgi:hypothetical protein